MAGSELNIIPPTNSSSFLPIRVGHGYDLHRLEVLGQSIQGQTQPVRPLILGGVLLDHTHGPVAHSDGDALYHAITDALLGAIAQPDIGQLFPDTDPRHDAQDSSVFLAAAAERVRTLGYVIGNLDATVILERPKISPHKLVMIANIARILGIDVSCVNVKGKSHESVDAVGEGRAVEVHCVVVLLAQA